MAIALSWPSHHSTAYLPAHGHLSARHSPIRACAVIAPDEQLQLRQLFDAQVADAADRQGKGVHLTVAAERIWVPHAICGRCRRG